MAGAALLALIGCASGPDPILSTGGPVPPNIERSLRCPRDTGIVFGRIGGVQSSAWCERGGAGGGIKHGPFVEWYENLQKKNVGMYEEGLRQGPWRFYLPSGQLESEVLYDRGNVVPQTRQATTSTIAPGAAPPSSAPTMATPSSAPANAPASASAPMGASAPTGTAAPMAVPTAK